MPAAAARVGRLKKGAQRGGGGLRMGAQSQMAGPLKMGARSRGPIKQGAVRSAMETARGGPGDRGPGGIPGQELSGLHGGPRMPQANAGQPEMATGAQGPAVMPAEPVAAPIPTGGSGKSADVGSGGAGVMDMGPTPKGVQDAGAGGGGRLLRPGTGLISPAAPIRPLDGGESVPAAVPPPGAQAEVAPMAKMMASRQPMSGFQPRRKPKSRPGYFTGA